MVRISHSQTNKLKISKGQSSVSSGVAGSSWVMPMLCIWLDPEVMHYFHNVWATQVQHVFSQIFTATFLAVH